MRNRGVGANQYPSEQTSSTRASGVNQFFTSQSPLQRRLGVYDWNPGPRRGTEDAIEKQIAGKWHLITLQEASDYVDHAILHERFCVTHFAGCAVLFNKDTIYANVDVKSIYLHDTRRTLPDHVVEGEHGWVLQGVVSRASFRRAASSGQTAFTVLSLHINNVFAKKGGISKKIIQAFRALTISQNIDLVAGDFAAATISVLLTKYFLTVPCRRSRSSHHCGDLDPSRTIGRMSVVF